MKEEAAEDYRLFVSWVAGVNKRIAEVNEGAAPLPYGFGPGELDYKPEPWEIRDPFAIAKLFMFGNSNSLENEMLATVVARLTPQVLDAIELPKPGTQTFTVPPEDRPSAKVTPRPGRPLRTGAPASAPSVDPERARASLRAFERTMSAFRVQGSNNWAIDGRFTESGRSLICNDPHQPLQSPSLMYALHLNSADKGGSFDVAGFGFAGAPGVQLGHNRKVYWAATTGFADVMDIWSVAFDEGKGTATVAGKEVAFETRTETIKVKGTADVTMPIREVPGYGTILDSYLLDEVLLVDAGRKALFNWTGFRPTSEPQAFVAMMKAEDVGDFEAAVDKMEVGTFNFLSADAGAISYHVNVLIPDRGDPAARMMPFQVIDGDDVGSYWTGAWLPGEKMPRSRAPQTGFIVTANNDPWGFTGDGDVGNDPWYYGTYYAPGYRAKRIEDRVKELTAAGGVTVEDMKALQLDTHSLMADALAPVLAATFAKVETDDALAAFRGKPELATLAQLITVDWDRSMTRDSAGALAFHVWLHILTRQALADDLGVFYDTILDAAPVYLLKFTHLAFTDGYPNGDAILQSGRDVLVMQALEQTAAWLTSNFGSVDPAGYRWGDRHGTAFENPYGGDLDGGWVPTDGGEDTINVSSTKFQDANGQIAERFDSHDGPIFRMSTDFAEDGTPQSWLNFPRGNSGDPTSAHWGDTLEDWVEGRHVRVPFSRAEVEAEVESRTTLKPE